MMDRIGRPYERRAGWRVVMALAVCASAVLTGCAGGDSDADPSGTSRAPTSRLTTTTTALATTTLPRATTTTTTTKPDPPLVPDVRATYETPGGDRVAMTAEVGEARNLADAPDVADRWSACPEATQALIQRSRTVPLTVQLELLSELDASVKIVVDFELGIVGLDSGEGVCLDHSSSVRGYSFAPHDRATLEFDLIILDVLSPNDPTGADKGAVLTPLLQVVIGTESIPDVTVEGDRMAECYGSFSPLVIWLDGPPPVNDHGEPCAIGGEP